MSTHPPKLSIVIPFYMKMDEFAITFPLNHECILKTGIDTEIVIALDENKSERDLIDFLGKFQNIRISIIINDSDHEWRNPSKAINVGIRNSNADTCLIISPESVISDQLIPSMMKLKSNENFVVGSLKAGQITDGELHGVEMKYWLYYGSIMFSKSHAEQITGYNERFQLWGADDDDFRDRLTRIGLSPIKISDYVTHYTIPGSFTPTKTKINSMVFVGGPVAPNKTWGEDFNRKVTLNQ